MDVVRTPQRWRRVDRPNRAGIWIQLLGADLPHPPYPDHGTLTETEADAIMQWTMKNQIGVRRSFDLWRFRNEKDLMAFLLKWC
jgi:hypothetical protein